MKTIAIVVLFAACAAPNVPAKPGYDTDIAPILEANCTRCHSTQAAVTTGNCYALDSWDDGTDPSGKCSPLYGVHSSLMNQTPTLGLVEVVESDVMPKDGPALTARQKEIFANWKAAGYPKSGNNHPPTITFFTPPPGGATINTGGVTTYDIMYDVEDPDGDPVTWSLGYSGNNGKTGTFATGLTQGTGTVHADTSALGTGTYQVIATLDDGSGIVMVTAQGTLTVPSNYNATPTVVIQEPVAGNYYYQGQIVTISWLGTDDGAQLTCDVSALVNGTTTVSIQTGVLEVPGQVASVMWTIPTTATLSPNYKIQVSVRDDGSPALGGAAQSGTFQVGPPPQPVSFSMQLVPMLTSTTDGCIKTGCHGTINPQQGLQLTASVAYNNIVGVSATETTNCGTGAEKLINPGDPNHSYFIAKLVGSGNCLTGTRMPKGETAFTPTMIQQWVDWTLNGAMNN